jgi:hypothetical protein
VGRGAAVRKRALFAVFPFFYGLRSLFFAMSFDPEYNRSIRRYDIET